MMPIPQAAPVLRIARFRSEVDAAIARVIDAGEYILGTAVEDFERSFAAYLGVKHVVGVGNGTDAITLALKASGVGRGDEVIAPALTAAGTAQGILATGAVVRFAEVDERTRCLDPDAVAAAITGNTAAIVAVHLFGQPCDIQGLRRVTERHGLLLLEDAAQAHGATIAGRKIGSFGSAAAFSFYPTKPLGAIGDGGAVATNDGVIAARVRALRLYGWESPDRVSRVVAGNSRLDSIQACVLLALLPKLDAGNRERTSVAIEYGQALCGLNVDLPPLDRGSVFHQYAIGLERRNELGSWLAKRGIGTAVHYDPPLHLHPAFSNDGNTTLSVTEHLSRRLLSLPIQSEIASPNAKRLVEVIREGIQACQAW